jgi:hypothetical protein
MDIKKSLEWVAEGLAIVHLASQLEEKNRYSTENDFLDTLDISECLSDSEDNDAKDWIVANEEEFRGMVKTYLNNRLNYLFNEGFAYREGTDYVLYTEAEIEQNNKHILNDD